MFDNWSDDRFGAWLGGFTDGEGYIGVESRESKGVSKVSVVLANTHEAVIRGIHERLGYGGVYDQKQKKEWRRKYIWKIGSLHDADRFLGLVYPHLVVKRTAADRALERIAEAQRRHRRTVERNRAIRRAAEGGEMRKRIARRFGLSPQSISRICEGHKWPSERSAFARKRKRDARGLFVPIDD